MRLQKTSLLKAFAILLLGAILIGGFYGILEMRFFSGSLYPHYASYRSDPLGTSAFYEALDGLDSRVVSRNVIDLYDIASLDGDSVLLLLGYPREGLDDLRFVVDSTILKSIENGARLVITINPGLVPREYQPRKSAEEQDWFERRRQIQEKTRKKKLESETDSDDDDISEEERDLDAEIDEQMGFRFLRMLDLEITSPTTSFRRPEDGWTTRRGSALAALPQGIALPAWRSQFRISTDSEAWQPVLLIGKTPVVMERSFGEGSIVVATDSYFVSNESLHLNRETDFLLWLLGDKKKVIFDETIHGSRETGGVMKLIRRHRGHGIFMGLAVFLFLWAWRSASPLIPAGRAGDSAGGNATRGDGADMGFIRLLHRSVSRSRLLDQCFELWQQTRAKGATAEQRRAVEEVMRRQRANPRSMDIVAAYQEIAQILRKR